MAMHDEPNRTYANHTLGKGCLSGVAIGGFGDANIASTAIPKPVEVTRGVMADAVILAQRIEALVNEIAGPKRMLEGKGEGGIRAEPMGILPEMADHAHQVSVVIRSAHAALDRLREVI